MREKIHSKLGFYLAAMCTAIGLGNIWRFPYIVAENGGGVFVLIYIIMSILVGSAMVTGELMIGKLVKLSPIVATDHLINESKLSSKISKLIRFIPKAAGVITLLVFSYYIIISGWLLHFVTQMFFSVFRGSEFNPDASFEFLAQNNLLQIGLMSIHFIAILLIVISRFRKLVERWIGVVIGIFIFLLIILVVNTMMLPTAGEALRFLFYPDFSTFSWSFFPKAFAHMCFTLSIGFGAMVTFGSYMKSESSITRSALRLTIADTIISTLMCLLIFPLMTSFSSNISGSELLFSVLPKLFFTLDKGFFLGLFFFVFLYVATLGAGVALLEIAASNLMDWRGWSRKRAAFTVGLTAFVVAVMPSILVLLKLKANMFGSEVALGVLDHYLIDILLPLSAFGFSMIVIFLVDKEKQKKEFIIEDEQYEESSNLFSHWFFLMKFILPLLFLIGFFYSILT